VSGTARRYRKLPLEVEAVVFEAIKGPTYDGVRRAPAGGGWQLKTANGWSDIADGDMIVTDVTSGDCWSVKPDIFAQTYEPHYVPPLVGGDWPKRP
jgi:hypothetical protein